MVSRLPTNASAIRQNPDRLSNGFLLLTEILVERLTRLVFLAEIVRRRRDDQPGCPIRDRAQELTAIAEVEGRDRVWRVASGEFNATDAHRGVRIQREHL